jgi:hypothetical protein
VKKGEKKRILSNEFVTIQKIRPTTEAITTYTYNGFEKAVLVIEAMEYAIFIFY